MRDSKGAPAREMIVSNTGDGAVTAPVILLVDAGTSGAAELFASALAGNQRADLIGEHTIGRAGIQKLVKLPDGSGLWLTTVRYLTPAGTPLHEKGLTPTVGVEIPDVEFGQPAPAGDPELDKAIERFAEKKAA
jgi:carboxyl-terminal processing protease